MLMRSMTSGAETTENRVAAKTNALIVGQLREMGSVVKDCVDSEVRKYYYLFCAMVAAEKTVERDMNGMNRKTTADSTSPAAQGRCTGASAGPGRSSSRSPGISRPCAWVRRCTAGTAWAPDSKAGLRAGQGCY